MHIQRPWKSVIDLRHSILEAYIAGLMPLADACVRDGELSVAAMIYGDIAQYAANCEQGIAVRPANWDRRKVIEFMKCLACGTEYMVGSMHSCGITPHPGYTPQFHRAS